MTETDHQDRRLGDIRLLRMEETLNNLSAKVNNGLSSRSKDTMATVKELNIKNVEMEKQLVHNGAKAEEVSRDISDIKISLRLVATAQQNWIKMFNRGLIVLLFGIFSAGGWLVLNIDEIDSVLDHIKVSITDPESVRNKPPK